MIRYLLLLLLWVTAPLSAFQYELSVCAIFQDEAPYLHEWIEYHRLLGTEHFYLYNNNSQDQYRKVLAPYMKQNIVTLTNWPSPIDEDWTPHQVKAYNDCIHKVKGVTHWLAFIDIDEFIVPVTHNSLPELLKEYPNVGGLQIFWQFFGTSGVYQIPKNKTLVETLIRKARKDNNLNYNCKTICQPLAVKRYAVHGVAQYHDHWHSLFPHRTRGGVRQPIHIDIVRIHHYWTRDEKYFREQKIPRRARLEGAPYNEEKIQSFLKSFNHERDDAILRFVPALRMRLGLPQN